ncbi:MAG TPA: RusA family crossover junction endodeoxyribonuclease [Thermoplasmata archaeon]|nr:RusA family crossover junction endodeoxyribonuclease [Thermoplasmata archaeon]
MKKFTFYVPGHPIGKEQHRKCKFIKYSKNGKPYYPRYTPKKTRQYAEKIRLCFRNKYRGQYNFSKKTQWILHLFIFYKGHCDYDKIANAYNDALQGCLWSNDTQIVEAHIWKFRVTGTDKKEGVRVKIFAVSE